MRARDVARPSAEDLAEAERELVIRRAAARIEARPLPTGITPAAVPTDRPAEKPAERVRQRGRSRPRPGPPPLA